MGAGIAVAIVLAALALVMLTFRSGVGLYKKLLGWLTLAGLGYFYQYELISLYRQVTTGMDYKSAVRDFVNLVQVSLPAMAFALFWMAFLVSSAMDAGKILIFFFVVFLLSAAAKIAFLI